LVKEFVGYSALFLRTIEGKPTCPQYHKLDPYESPLVLCMCTTPPGLQPTDKECQQNPVTAGKCSDSEAIWKAVRVHNGVIPTRYRYPIERVKVGLIRTIVDPRDARSLRALFDYGCAI
jgi:hypothetical protein